MKLSNVLKPLVGRLESCVSLERRDETSDDRVGRDAVGSVNDGADAENGAEQTSNGLLDRVLEHGRVLGPVVVEKSYAFVLELKTKNLGSRLSQATNRKPLPWYQPERAQVLCSWGRALKVACDCQSRPLTYRGGADVSKLSTRGSVTSGASSSVPEAKGGGHQQCGRSRSAARRRR